MEPISTERLERLLKDTGPDGFCRRGISLKTIDELHQAIKELLLYRENEERKYP